MRAVEDLEAYLECHPDTDFIESVTTADVPWVTGGLALERFTLRFPFSWRKNRKLFDRYVDLQRRFKLQRSLPDGVVPHLGSQWWCLTRGTLSAILKNPNRKIYDTYFRKVWIPDESYFQTLVRLHGRKIQSRSLTLYKFDHQGKPHVFYDDHLPLLRQSKCFVARKIWPHADRLYERFLDKEHPLKNVEPNAGKIKRLFSKAAERRVQGRTGLTMQSRLPRNLHENGFTSARYSVFEGFADLFEDFIPWLARTTGAQVHGHLFAKKKVEFENGQRVFNGALSDSAKLRDDNAPMFLSNLIWNTRGTHQCFQFGPADRQTLSLDLAHDPNAQISIISGAWAVPLYRSGRTFSDIRPEAAALQRVESEHLDALRSRSAKARIRIWTLAEFIETPIEFLQLVVREMGCTSSMVTTEPPKMTDLTGFGLFLQDLKNQGMQPHLMGDFPTHGRSRPE